jgi:ectoine hydroxylase-related dioxygenase (phytanoyl-CoA dioxygenase family)
MPNTVWHVRHHDHPTPTDYYLPSQRTTKVFVALWDIPENGGCTALVPKTHRLPGELTYSLFLSVPLPCVGAQDSPVACFMLEFPYAGCFLPGSQVGQKLLARGFRTHAERHNDEGATNGSRALPQEAMPNHVKMAIPAGSGFLFDSSVWHTCELSSLPVVANPFFVFPTSAC